MANKIKCTCGHSWNKSDSSKKDATVCHICGKNNMKNGGWLDAYDDVPQAQNGIEGTMGGLTDKGFNYNGAWGGTMQMGGAMPGAVGFTYARTGSIPSNGPYAKKTKASAQDGKEVEYKELPEIVVVGGKDKPTVDLYRNELDKLTPTPPEGNPYNDVESYGKYYAKMQMAKEFGVPKIRPAKSVGKVQSFLRNRSGVKSDPNETWPQYSPFTKTVYSGFDRGMDYRDEYIPELSHYLSQKNQGTLDYLKGGISNFLEYAKGNNPYNIKGTEENIAHEQLEPMLLEAYDKFQTEGRKKFMEAAHNSMTRKLYEKNRKLQNGGEMKFYQEGLDWKPRNISRNGSEIPVDPMGYWNPDNVGEPVIIPSNEITMEGVYQPLLGISDTGDTQMMYPGEDYEFDGESVTEYPIAQKGKKVSAPTTADSLKVYNAAIKLTDYYKNDKRHKAPHIDLYSGTVEQSRIDDVGRQNLNMYRDMYKLLADPGFKYEGSREELDYGLSRQELLKKVGQAIAESKSASPGTAYYKDAFPSKIDVNAPSAYVDSRISPQGFMYFNSTVPKNNRGVVSATEPAGSITGAWYYDPIAIKPVAMRTPQEQKEFNKKYGNPTPAIVSKPKPKKEPKKEQPKPTPTIVERKQNVYEGSPVYSATVGSGGPSALIGFANQKGDTTYIKPEDYERFGVPKYGKEFIQNRKKQRNGGVNNADAQPIEKLDQLLNFTNYNKPTKGGWLDKWAD